MGDDITSASEGGATPRRRSWWALGAFALGLWVGGAVDAGASGLWFSIAAALAGLAMLAPVRMVGALLLASVMTLGIGWWHFRHREADAGHLATLLAAAQRDQVGALPLTVEGMVLETPREARRTPGTLLPGFDRPGSRFALAAQRVIDGDVSRPVHGVLLVTVRAWPEAVLPRASAGSAIRLTGMAEAVEAPMNPGEFDFLRWARDRGRAGSLMVPGMELVAEAPSGGLVDRAMAMAIRGRAWVRDRAERVMESAMEGGDGGRGSGAERALVFSLFLGASDPAHPEIDAAFNRLGLAHVLAISGFHIVIMAWVALQLVRLTGEHGRLEPLIVAALVSVYMMIVPPGAPVVRAGVLVLVMLAAELLERRYDRVTLLGWIGLGLLVWRPADLYTLGYPLSLGLTALLLWMGEVTHERLWGIQLRGTLDRSHEGLVPWLGEHVRRLISTSVLCWTAAAPLVLERAGMLSPMAVVSTVLLTPLVLPAMALGFATLLIGMFVPGAAAWSGVVLGELARWTLDVVFWMDELPGASIRVVGVTPAWAAGATLLILCWHRFGHWRAWNCWAASAVMVLWLGVLVTRAGQLGPGVSLRIDTLAVGDGACHLVRAAGEDGAAGASMLIDCGSTRVNIGRRLIPDALRALGVRGVDAVLISRPEPSRYAALPDLIRVVPVRRVLVGRALLDQAESIPLGPAARMLWMLDLAGIEIGVVEDGAEFELGAARGQAIWPPPALDVMNDADRSLVVLMRAAGGAALFTSDIREEAIATLRRERPELRAAVVEAPARGAVSVAAEAWMRELRPRVVVQSTGDQRAGDGRWDAIRARATWWTTATDGASWVELYADGSVRSGCTRASR